MATRKGQIQPRQKCEAQSKATGGPCGAWAISNSLCWNHGGRNPGGAPSGNKNRLTTGEHEAIWLDVLEPDERELYHQINTEKLAQVEEEIRLTTIREKRMLQRIAGLKVEPMVLVEESTKTLAPDEVKSADEEAGHGFSDRWASEEPPDSRRSHQASQRADRQTENDAKPGFLEVKQKRVGNLAPIQDIEEALTRVQAHKAKLVELKHKLQTEGGDLGNGNAASDLGALAQDHGALDPAELVRLYREACKTPGEVQG